MNTATTDFFGREEELAQLRQLINANPGGLLLVVGRPHVGKQQLLRYLWHELGAQGRHQLVPATADDRFLRIDPRTDIKVFEEATETNPDAIPIDFGGGRVIGIYGYQPSKVFAEWFTSRFLPGLRGSGSADRGSLPLSTGSDPEPTTNLTTVVLAGFARDVESLVLYAAAEPIVLEPLPLETIKDRLVAHTAGLLEPLTLAELDAYADLIRNDAGILEPLLRVLALDSNDDTQ